ncbi:MAG: WD40 repeat-containing protein [Amphiamblys sp. WSBS2006]|nr:MAG: WD40 repeat-containing protein [Amphiamblys sp. WSBS2006]
MEAHTALETQPDALVAAGSAKQFVCAGTYEMRREDGVERRHGEIYTLDGRGAIVCSVSTGAVLDLLPLGSQLLSAQSESTVGLHTLLEDGGLVEERSFRTEEDSRVLCLAVAAAESSVYVGRSNGTVVEIDGFFHGREAVSVLRAHEYEVWCCFLDTDTPRFLYTGSTDCFARGWCLRSSQSPCFSIRHPSGVCSVYQEGSSVWTGSYDGVLREWDKRSLGEAVREYSGTKGGGIWRIKKTDDGLGFLLACVSGGAARVSCSLLSTGWAGEAESLCYGVTEAADTVFWTDFYGRKVFRSLLRSHDDPGE